jgi:hypothetical protein
MQIGNIIIEKVLDEEGELEYISFKDLEDPGYEYKEYTDGIKAWFRNGEIHREDGPAAIWPDRSKIWYINGKRHREDGPALICPDGLKAWYLDGIEYTEEEFKEEVKKWQKH